MKTDNLFVTGSPHTVGYHLANDDGVIGQNKLALDEIVHRYNSHPDLLEACRALVAECEKLPDFHPSERRAIALGNAITAIAKALATNNATKE